MTSSILQRNNILLNLQERLGHCRPVLIKEPGDEISTNLYINQLHNEYAIT